MVFFKKFFTVVFIILMITVNIVIPASAWGAPDTVSLTVNPSSQIIGSSSVIMAYASNTTGGAVDDGTNVLFTTNFGTFDESGTNTYTNQTVGGYAAAHLNSAAIGNATINVSSGSVLNVTYVSFVPSINLGASPQGLYVGNSSTITANLTDSNGNPVNGVEVTFNLTMKNEFGEVVSPPPTFYITSANDTTVGGIATTTLFSNKRGIATVVATAGGSSDYINVTFVPSGPANLALTATPQITRADNTSTSIVSATILDSLGNPCNSGGVTFDFSPDVFNGSVGRLINSTTGKAVIEVGPTNSVFLLLVNATSNTGLTNNTTISFLPVNLTMNLRASPTIIAIPGINATQSSSITATVLYQDDLGDYRVFNGQDFGIFVNFSTTSGTFVNGTQDSIPLSQRGEATAVLTSENSTGTKTISATISTLYSSASDTTEVKFTDLPFLAVNTTIVPQTVESLPANITIYHNITGEGPTGGTLPDIVLVTDLSGSMAATDMGWQEVVVNIPEAAKGDDIQFKWLFECDGSSAAGGTDGWWIDDIEIAGEFNDFEGGSPGWQAKEERDDDKDTAVFALVEHGSGYYRSGTHAWWVDNADDQLKTYLTSPTVSVSSDSTNPQLKFWYKINTEDNYDGGWLQYRIGGPSSTWQDVTNSMIYSGKYTGFTGSSCPSGQHEAWEGKMTRLDAAKQALGTFKEESISKGFGVGLAAYGNYANTSSSRHYSDLTRAKWQDQQNNGTWPFHPYAGINDRTFDPEEFDDKSSNHRSDAHIDVDITMNGAALQAAIDSYSARGGTNIGGGINAGNKTFHQSGNPNHAWYMILMSDGHPTMAPIEPDSMDAYMPIDWGTSSPTDYSETGKWAAINASKSVKDNTDITIYTIMFGNDALGESILEEVASDAPAGSNRTKNYFHAVNSSQLQQIYTEIYQEIEEITSRSEINVILPGETINGTFIGNGTYVNGSATASFYEVSTGTTTDITSSIGPTITNTTGGQIITFIITRSISVGNKINLSYNLTVNNTGVIVGDSNITGSAGDVLSNFGPIILGTNGTVDVDLGTGTPVRIRVWAIPNSIVANGTDATTIYAYLETSIGGSAGPAVDGTTIRFGTDRGMLNYAGTTAMNQTVNATASVILNSSQLPIDLLANVSATYGGLTNYTDVTFDAEDFFIEVSADPNRIYINDETSTITATLNHTYLTAIPSYSVWSNVSVDFSTTMGTFTSTNPVSSTNGTYKITFNSSTPGNAIITANALSPGQGGNSTTVIVWARGAITLS